jgi:hypothetical protein
MAAPQEVKVLKVPRDARKGYQKFKMNTLSILDANTANISEGLYLELTNALKKDFENVENVEKPIDYRVVLLEYERELEFRLYGYNYDDNRDAEDNLSFLRDFCYDLPLVKKVFEKYYEDDDTEYIWDIDNDEIIQLDLCISCKVKVRSLWINPETDICFNCEAVECNFCKRRIFSRGIEKCQNCGSNVCKLCNAGCCDGCADCVLTHFTKSLSSYASPYIPLLNFIPKLKYNGDYLEHIISASFTKILNTRFQV